MVRRRARAAAADVTVILAVRKKVCVICVLRARVKVHLMNSNFPFILTNAFTEQKINNQYTVLNIDRTYYKTICDHTNRHHICQ